MKVNVGQDKQAKALASGAIGTFGTASASTATSLTTSGLVASALVGQIVIAGDGTGPTVYGVITANTTTVITVDRWYNPTAPTGAVGTTPTATSKFVVVPGNAPAWYMALTNTVSFTPSATDTTLSAEQTTNGLSRVAATYAHTTGATTYTLSNTFTYTGSTTVALTGMATFDALTGGTMFHESAITSATVNASGDQVTLTQTVTM